MTNVGHREMKKVVKFKSVEEILPKKEQFQVQRYRNGHNSGSGQKKYNNSTTKTIKTGKLTTIQQLRTQFESQSQNSPNATTIIIPKQRRVSSTYRNSVMSLSPVSLYSQDSMLEDIASPTTRNHKRLSSNVTLSFGSRRTSLYSNMSMGTDNVSIAHSTQSITADTPQPELAKENVTPISNSKPKPTRVSATSPAPNQRQALQKNPNVLNVANRHQDQEKFERITNSLTKMYKEFKITNHNKDELIKKIQSLKEKNELNFTRLENLTKKIDQVESNVNDYSSKVENDCTLIMICMCLIKNI